MYGELEVRKIKNMAKVILGVTISLDGFAEDVNGSVGTLYPDLDTLRDTEVLQESIHNTGSVVMAWKEFAMAEDPDWFAGNYEYQVPIFVFTDKTPKMHPKETGRLTFTFVTDGIKSAVRQAKAVAGDKNVTIIGSASTTAQCIRAGLADELHIDIIPIFLKAGFRPFEDIRDKSIKLERIKIIELPAGRTHLRFRFVK
jgi:dihydrofolate reductase